MTYFISADAALKIHDDLIDAYGGAEGIRDYGLLLSALEMPKASFGGTEMHPAFFDKAAAYLYHVARNHPFIDGNKRTAAALALTFLEMNHVKFKIDMHELEELVVATAQGLVSKQDIAHCFALYSPTP